MPQPRAQRTKRRTIWRRARRYGKRTFAGTAGALAPSLYRAWMGFVWHTSRRVDHGLDALLAEAREVFPATDIAFDLMSLEV